MNSLVRRSTVAMFACVAASIARAEVPDVVRTIDARLAEAWKARRLAPAPRVDDAGFLRRASLDILGRLPDPARIEAFLADDGPDKRSRLIDELLADERYAQHWAEYWDALLMGRLTREAYLDRFGFQRWLREEFAANRPWNEFVGTLLTAEGYNTDRRPAGASSDPADFQARYAPATNWFLRHSRSLPELAGTTSRLFLGVQIQCAQCHDHKTEPWKQQDFRQFTAFFAKTWPSYYDRSLGIVGTLRIDTKDRLTPPPTGGKFEQYFGSYKEYVHDWPKPLEAAEIRKFGSRRQALARWLTDDENPWFARALVNRMWAELTGRGFVEPIDDFRPGNPPVLPEVLDVAARDFIDHGYDVRRLIRVICNSSAYDRACRPATTQAGEHSLWSAFPVKPLEVEEMFDAVLQACDAEDALAKLSKGKMDLVRTAFVRQFVQQMNTDDQAETAQAGESIPRSLLMMNGALINGPTRHTPGYGLTATLRAAANDDDAVRRLYLRTMSRPPTAGESAAWNEFLRKPRSVARAPGPPTRVKSGPAAAQMSRMITEAPADGDFAALVARAETAADFAALFKRMKNNADAGLLVKAFEAWAAEVPFQYLASVGGGDTTREQALEDIYWALLNSAEFLSNH